MTFPFSRKKGGMPHIFAVVRAVVMDLKALIAGDGGHGPTRLRALRPRGHRSARHTDYGVIAKAHLTRHRVLIVH